MNFSEQIFYTRNISADKLFLDDQEAQHCTKVLRKKVSDKIVCADGKGNSYTGEIVCIGRDSVECKILETNFHQQSESLIIAVSPTKNRERLEWMVEKLTELGVKEILLISCDRTERTRINTDRLEKKVISAMKQAMRYYLPEIREMDFSEVLHMQADSRWIAHCMEDSSKTKLSKAHGSALVLIGPEGDFTEEEIEQALAAGFRTLDLGNFRLRTETAALLVAARNN